MFLLIFICVCVMCIHDYVRNETGDRLPLVTATGSAFPHYSQPLGVATVIIQLKHSAGVVERKRVTSIGSPPILTPPTGCRPRPFFLRDARGAWLASFLFMRLHRYEQIPPRPNKKKLTEFIGYKVFV